MTTSLHLILPCPKCKAASGVRCLNLQADDGSFAVRPHIKRTPLAPCGSIGGYQRHKKAGEAACEECKEANRRYMAEHRKKNPTNREADIAQLRVRREATRLLIARHRAEFDRLLSTVQVPA